MTVFRTMKVKQFRWNQDTTEANVAPLEVSDIFGKESIAEYAPKIAAIVDLIDRGEGI